jgi:hypothetical protein
MQSGIIIGPRNYIRLYRGDSTVAVKRDTTRGELIYYNPRLKRVEGVCQYQKARCDTTAKPTSSLRLNAASEGDSGHRFTSRKLTGTSSVENGVPILCFRPPLVPVTSSTSRIRSASYFHVFTS